MSETDRIVDGLKELGRKLDDQKVHLRASWLVGGGILLAILGAIIL